MQSNVSQFSIPYVVSAALLKGSLGVEAFEEERIRDKKVLAFARKVKLMIDPAVTPYFPAHEPSKVIVRLKNGTCCSTTVICSKGTPDNPMSDRELEAKFCGFATQVIPARSAEKAIELIRSLDALGSVKELSAVLGKKVA